MLEPEYLFRLRARYQHEAKQYDNYEAENKRNSHEESRFPGIDPTHTLYIILFDILNPL